MTWVFEVSHPHTQQFVNRHYSSRVVVQSLFWCNFWFDFFVVGNYGGWPKVVGRGGVKDDGVASMGEVGGVIWVF